jgi:hypothetical protein
MEQKQSWVEKLKNRYKLENAWDLVLVFVLFAITGSSSVKVAKPLLDLIGMSKEVTNPWLFWPVRVVLVFVAYQLLFLFYGFLIGQIRKPVWDFTWFFSQKMLSRFGLFRGNK